MFFQQIFHVVEIFFVLHFGADLGYLLGRDGRGFVAEAVAGEGEDGGDFVVIVNADKVVLTSGKAEKKLVHRHSGYPGGLKSETYAEKMARKPEQAVMDTIRGMIPKTRLGRAQISKLKVYAGPTHPHSAQNPQPLEIAHAKYEARA